MKGKPRPLEVLLFGRTGFMGSLVFRATKVTIGREAEAMVRLDDPLVSLKHAELTLEGGLFRLKDLGSRTGTRVNGSPLLPRQPIEPTDEISIGSYRLRVTTLESDSLVPPADPEARPLANAPSVPPLAPVPALDPSPMGGRTVADLTPRGPAPGPAHEGPRTGHVATRLAWHPGGVDFGPSAGAAPPAPASAQHGPELASASLGWHPEEETTRVVPVPSKPPSLAPVPVAAAVRGAAPRQMPTLGESFSTQVDLRPANSPAPEPPPSTSRLDTPRHVVPVDLAFADMFDPARQTSPDPGSVAPPKPVVAAQPRPLVEAPKPAVAEPPKPVAAQPRPLVEAPKPAVAEPRKPVAAAQPRAKVEAPKPAVAAQLPVLEASRPAVLAPTLAEPPNLAAPYRGEEDDEDDDEDFVPAFDLIEALARSGCTGDPAQDEGGAALEIVECRRELVLSVRHPKAGGPVCLSGKGDPIGAVEADGTFALEVGACRALVVRQAGRELSPAQVSARRDGSRLRLTPGMSATVDLQGEDKALVHWTPKAAALPRPRVSLRPGRDGMTTGALSVALHLGIGLFIGLVVLGGKKTAEADINAGRFATIQTKELELEPPPPTPPPETPPPEGAPTVDMAPPTHDQPVRNPSATPTPGPRRAGSDSAPASASAQKILSALGGAPSAISTDAIAVTNLDALPVAAGGFKVSGSVGKAPGDTLRVAVAAGGGREVDTKSASELGGNDLGRVAARGGEGGPVRARVTAAPQAIRGEGHLDRGEIQKVVNAHLYQVQGCYERQLAKDPSLSGKISYEWVVDVSGGVSSVRVGRSTVHSVEVTTCIQSAIQGWKFPPPSGGSVTVTYPFAFSSLGG